MAKELVISSNRHETKVAILEDDQLVEVFFQRANEYSLAGSIHKGRVTRVLPGMQSAFVDLGLERDTFLYVSDFFEDSGEEYDSIPPSEDRPGRSHRTEVHPAVAPPPPVQPVAPMPGVTLTPPVDRPPVAEPRDDADTRGGRDRRSRRTRRRRGHERGLPESKYSHDMGPSRAPAPPDTKTLPVAEEEFPVLPGESLAKYSRPVSEDPSETPAEGPGDAEDALPEPALEEALSAEPPETGAPPVPEGPPATPAAAPLTEFEEGEIREMILEAQRDAGRREEEEEEIEETEPVELEAASEEGQEALEESGETGVEAQQAEAEVEPARQPASLTAALREQGQRYPHRASRRMRRRMRQEDPAPGAGAPAPAAAPETREVRAEHQPDVLPERPQPSISDLLREGQEIIVQIAKEPLGQKGARITSHIALPGRYVVYMPTLEHMGVSRKISSDEERLRLKRILQTHRVGMTGGFILRTAGEGHTEQEVAADMRFLYSLWQDIRQKAEKRPAPALLHHDLDIVRRILRDQFTESFKAIWTDNEEVYESILGFVQRFQPPLVSRVKLYTRPDPIFDAFNVTQELEKALRPKVWLKSGGYIVINQTEALVAIDVNTGKFVGKSNRLEDTIVKINTEAVKEIARQMRLRDLGGIIVIDFIDMDERKNRQKVMQALEEAMRADRAPYKILQFNDFGLVAITRKRVKQSLERALCASCPYCEGAGYVKSVQTVIGEILQEAHKMARVIDSKDVILRVNPDVAKLLKSTENKYLEELEEILGRPVLVRSDALLHQEKFDLA
jgi:ribonuclease G